MKLEFLSKDKDANRIVFMLKDANPFMANALRRLVADAVPVFAIATVEFANNTSALYDEMLAHRLGLIPLSSDASGYNRKENCSCEGVGCNKCTVQLTLQAKGPCTVFSKDLKSKDPEVKPIIDDLPIVELLKGQVLEFVATACLGCASEHAKFSPGLAWFSYKPSVTVNNDAKSFASVKDKFPPQVFDGDKISKGKIEDLDLYDAVDGVDADVVRVDYDPSTFIFKVESWGQLTPKEIVVSALEALEKKLALLGHEIDRAGVAEPGQMRTVEGRVP